MAERLQLAAAARSASLTENPEGAFRLFNGFTEGIPDLVVDWMAGCAVIFNLARPPETLENLTAELLPWLRSHLPGLKAILLKTRHAANPEARRGELLWGDRLPEKLTENGIHYALDLRLNQDASFYLDTRPLRSWLVSQSAGKRVLNTFAYTGSLGIAALAGGALQVDQTDRSARFLQLAWRSSTLNCFNPSQMRCLSGDFFNITASLRRQGALYDLILLDPPFFSESSRGRVDLARNLPALINKVRPLGAHESSLVVVNNALFVSGQAFMAGLRALCQDGYMRIETCLDIPEDITGSPVLRSPNQPVNPAPFNHSTKIAVLRITRKDRAAAREAA